MGLSEFRKFCKECSELIGRVGRGWNGGFEHRWFNICGLSDEEDANIPAMVSWVVLSTRALLLRSTERWKWWRKLAPRIGLLTSATTKIQGRERLRPRFRVRDFLPYVAMLEPLAAWRLKCGWGCFLSVGDGGNTLTAAPVSTKKVQWLVVSCM